MNKIHISYDQTEIGEMIIGSYKGKLCLLDFNNREIRKKLNHQLKKALDADFIEREDDIIVETKKQLEEYLKGRRKEFTIPLLMIGTEFQQLVWKELMDIPYGRTASYLDIAKRIHKPKSFRAVAMANKYNKIAIIIPCHRVIRENGNVSGYGGGSTVKERLIALEKNK